MRIRFLYAVPALLAFASFADAAPSINADELVAKNVAARGGMESIAAIQSLKLEGKLFLAGLGAEVRATQTFRRPGSFRSEATLQGLTLVRATDGKESWRISPFGGRKDPERTAPDDAKDLVESADFEGAWINAAAKGNKIDYLGIEDVDGTDAHKLKVTLKNGDIEYVYFDPDAFLVIRTVQQRTVRGVEVSQETDYSDYERATGTYLAFATATGGVGDTQKSKFTVEKADVNPVLDDAFFAFPAAK
jgi:hypothetical protein